MRVCLQMVSLLLLWIGICSVQSVNGGIESRIILLEKALGETRRKLTFAKDELSSLKGRKEKRTFVDDGQPILFTAQLKQHLHNFGHRQPIKFDHVIINDVSGYDSTTGIFIAPGDGNYLFTVTVMCVFRGYVEVQLVVNGSPEMHVYAGSPSRFDQTTSVAVVELKRGDRVWVETFNNAPQGIDLFGVYGDLWSSFSGSRVAT